MHKCIAQRRALLGLDAPTLVAPVRPDGTPLGFCPEVLHVVHELKQQLLEDRDYLDYLRQVASDDDQEQDTIPVQWANDGRHDDGLIQSRGKD